MPEFPKKKTFFLLLSEAVPMLRGFWRRHCPLLALKSQTHQGVQNMLDFGQSWCFPEHSIHTLSHILFSRKSCWENGNNVGNFGESLSSHRKE